LADYCATLSNDVLEVKERYYINPGKRDNAGGLY